MKITQILKNYLLCQNLIYTRFTGFTAGIFQQVNMPMLKFSEIKIAIVFISIISFSCRNNSDETNYSEARFKINIDEIEFKEKVYFTDLFDNFRIVPLETNNESKIGSIDQIHFCNDKIVVLDRRIAKSVLIFDSKGKFIRKIGKIGKGKGEYLNPLSISISQKNELIAILCSDTKKVLIYNMEGVLINEIKLKTSNSVNKIVFHGNNILADVYPEKGSSSDDLLYLFNASGEVIDTWVSNMKHRNGFAKRFNFHPTVFCQSESSVRYFKPFMNVVFELQDNKLTPYLWLESKNKYSISEINEFNNDDDFEMKYMNLEKLTGINSCLENDNFIFLRFKYNRVANYLILDKKNNEVIASKRMTDNMTNIKSPQFISAYKNSIAIVLDENKMEEFIQNNKDKKNTNFSKTIDISNINRSSNPVIVFYYKNQ